MLVEEVAETAAKWPADWTLVLHERERRSPDDPFLRRVAEARQGCVRLSLNPVPYCELDEVFASADVSLVLYSNEYGDNFRLIGRASGKLAHSLRVGVPVVCSDLPGLSSMIEEYGCGVVVKEMSEVEDAVRRILGDYQRFRERAWACLS
jgi:glycosyltransferase involved in cell wall biosynthesis